MMPTKSHTSATIPRACVIMSMTIGDFSLSSLMSLSTWAWMVTSRAVVGSSAIRRSGLQARAMAMITRCFMPPENWCGYSDTRSPGMPTISSMFVAWRRASLSLTPRWIFMPSAICSPTVLMGLSEDMGSWKTMAT